MGNPGKRALPKHEPRPDLGVPDKPDTLSPVAAEEWDRLAPQLGKLGLLTHIDMTAFVAYCECYADYILARRDIEKYGRVVEHGDLLKRNPAVQMANDSLRLMRQYLMEFGLTPSSRAKVASQAKNNQNQPPLPGMETTSTNPHKPAVPSGPLNDDHFFNVRH